MATNTPATPSTTTVLVTGGSGFVASHLILQLLATGYTVRTTVRSLSREPDVRKCLQAAGASADALARLSFFAADLTKDDGWASAVNGCTYVLHVASPFPGGAPKSEDELILPAREGTLRVLRAARDAGVVRVVLTSSFAAIGYGQPKRKDPFTEKDWSPVDGKIPIPAYHKSKTLAEKDAWDFQEKEGGAVELVVINPTGIFGPVLGADFSASIQIIQKLMDGGVPACPQIYFSVVDVRDLADLHIRAMVSPAAKGERFIATSDSQPTSFLDIAKIIRQGRPDEAGKVPTKQLPNLLVKALAILNPALREMVPQLGEIRMISSDKARTMLGWKSRPIQETILDTADSLVAHHVI